MWPAADVASEFSDPVVSDVPVLFLAGGRDHVTPVDYARRIAAGFRNSRLIVVEEMAHFASAISDIECIDAMAQAFDVSANPAAVDDACIVGMKAPPFELPG